MLHAYERGKKSFKIQRVQGWHVDYNKQISASFIPAVPKTDCKVSGCNYFIMSLLFRRQKIMYFCHCIRQLSTVLFLPDSEEKRTLRKWSKKQASKRTDKRASRDLSALAPFLECSNNSQQCALIVKSKQKEGREASKDLTIKCMSPKPIHLHVFSKDLQTKDWTEWAKKVSVFSIILSKTHESPQHPWS